MSRTESQLTDPLKGVGKKIFLLLLFVSALYGEFKEAEDDHYTYAMAESYCHRLEGGAWRLPSIKELYSLMDFRGGDPSGYGGSDPSALTPFLDTGDFVVIVNAERVRLTGNKLDDKVYYRHSGRPGSLKSETVRERLAKKPEKVIEAAVWGMLPKNRLGRKLLRKLKVYQGPEHPHQAQQPKTLAL